MKATATVGQPPSTVGKTQRRQLAMPFIRDKDTNATKFISRKAVDDEKMANEILSGWHYYDSKGKETDASIFANSQVK
jgi:hypothetical protein